MKFPSGTPASTQGKRTLLSKVRAKIFTGVLLATPIMATIWIFDVLLRATTSWFPREYFDRLDQIFNGYLLNFLVLLLVLALFYALGLLAHYFLGKRIYHLVDRLFSGIPFIKNIYIFVRQLCEWVAKSRDTMFESVVLVEYPRRGCYAIGLVTATTAPMISDKIRDESGQPLECVNVFISTTPNPTSGFLAIIPKRDVIWLDIDVSFAINMIISAGAILPERNPDAVGNPLLDMVDQLAHRQPAAQGPPPPAP